MLKEIHLPQEQLESTLRFSFSRFTTEEEIDYCLDALAGAASGAQAATQDTKTKFFSDML